MKLTAVATSAETWRRYGRFLPLASLLMLAAPAAHAQTTQPISPTAGLPVVTAAFNHTSLGTVSGTLYDFNYYDFNITGFTNVGAANPYYEIFSFGNSTLEKLPGVAGVASSYLPSGWTFSDTNDFLISTSAFSGIFPDDPQFGLIFIQDLGTQPINPTGAPFFFYHGMNAVDPFTLNGVPVTVPVTGDSGLPSVVPESSGLANMSAALLALGLGGLVMAVKKKKAKKAV